MDTTWNKLVLMQDATILRGDSIYGVIESLCITRDVIQGETREDAMVNSYKAYAA